MTCALTGEILVYIFIARIFLSVVNVQAFPTLLKGRNMIMNSEYAFPKTISSEGIKSLRKKLNMTQKEFAALLGVSKPTVERWEQGGKGVSGVEAILFDIINEHPEYIIKKKIEPSNYRLRLAYMYHDKICAVIDVDESNRIVDVTNYTDMVIYRPFGNNTAPTYEEYEEFIESRCFPRTRDKMKLELEKLGIPFYDPILIIEKTQGRMEEDDFWIDIVR